MSDDRSILNGYLNASRYITRDVYSRYGFDASNYPNPPKFKQVIMLKERLNELIKDLAFTPVYDETSLHNLLGEDFRWVRSCKSEVLKN